MYRQRAPELGTAGFTLLEALVALAIVAIALSSIGALIANTVRGTRSLDQRLARLATARTILSALPDRDQLGTGELAGETAGLTWRIDATPFPVANDSLPHPRWVPRSVIITVQSPTGGSLQFRTVRLYASEAK